MNADDIDQEDEGWIWLPHEELQRLQREKNRWMSDLVNAIPCVSPLQPAPLDTLWWHYLNGTKPGDGQPL